MTKIIAAKNDESAEKLRSLLTDTPVLMRRGISWVKKREPLKYKLALNDDMRTPVNTQYQPILNAVNKWRMVNIFKRRGIPMPYLYTNRKRLGRFDYPVVRKELQYSENDSGVVAGEVRLIESAHHLPGHDPILAREYFLEYIPDATEFRMHVLKDKVIATYEKTGCSDWIKDFDHGVLYSIRAANQIKEEVIIKLKRVAIRAVAALGLDTGGVDIAITPKGRVVVYEVNTAPGIGKRTALAYYIAIKKIIQEAEYEQSKV